LANFGASTTRPTVPAGRCGEVGDPGRQEDSSPGESARPALAVFDDLQHDVAFDLIEQLAAGVHMIVAALVGRRRP